MLECTFELNGKAMSALRCGALAFPAFSGMPTYKNQPESTCIPDFGAIPRGTYFIVDRESGGTLGPFKDMFTGKSDWFALYAIDRRIDDYTFCRAVERGNFRLHPKGLIGKSKGCITIESALDFYRLRVLLRGRRTEAIQGTSLRTYGKVVVK
ncbi:DUF2778 domain-containing protein [Cupriavidus campinensis]|uniref:DUF2778 domain-containing protein n=1 Tax=Cupriavidus campinensis TaxID=151783 RepID=UPI0011EC7F4E|nr:DUF2778 domain-containing protein [Cupriavidus campinensis]